MVEIIDIPALEAERDRLFLELTAVNRKLRAAQRKKSRDLTPSPRNERLDRISEMAEQRKTLAEIAAALGVGIARAHVLRRDAKKRERALKASNVRLAQPSSSGRY